LDPIGEEILRQESANGSKFYQPIYQESIPRLPVHSQPPIASGQSVIYQSYVIPRPPSIPSAPIFVAPQPLPQQGKAESQIVYAKIDSYAPLPRPEPSRPIYQPEVPKYESYQAPQNKPTKAQPPPSESFKYESSKPSYNQADISYESWKQDYKPYVPETKTSNSYYPGGNALNVN
jgi:hypothetical protein